MNAGELLRRYAAGERDFSKANLGEVNLIEADLRGANLIEADLSGAYLSEANLRGADFRGAYLSGANLRGADLSGADLRGTDLSVASLRGANFSYADLSRADLSVASLRGANFSYADLSYAKFSYAKFSYAKFSYADLSRVQLLGAILERATLTGACIEDWNINSNTKLDGVICDYVYLKDNHQERRPHTGNFQPGEFTKLFQESLETVDLIFREGVDWKGFLISFQKLQIECGSDELSIQSFENKGDGAFVVRVNVPSSANKAEIEKYLKRQYQLEAKFEAKSEQLANLLEITKLLASKPINIEAKSESSSMSENQKTENKFYAPVGSVSNKGNQTGFAGKVEGNLIGTQYNYPAEKQQTLAEAAEEIQKLLKQLEETNPTATEVEKQGYVNALVPSNNKTKIVNALQAGWKEAIKELLDNPYLNVAIATLEGWKSAGM
ncbi:MAG: pentapeptide repeat-containing protein [Symploca sp. SIO2D2]|nr:pentapeptide repeat-containing protein [Symploca sp. SIO2D2]